MKNILLFLAFLTSSFLSSFCQFCHVSEIFFSEINKFDQCSSSQDWQHLTQNEAATIYHDDPVFIMYSVSPVEGFNLRRDVYLRMAIFMKNLRQVEGYRNSFLVLPAFHHLYHWKSHFQQMNMFWNHFFDLNSLKMYTTVLDMWEFFEVVMKLTGQRFVNIDEVYRLQHFESMMESGMFVDKYEEIACPRNNHENNHYLEYFNISEKTITCLNFQGSSLLLIDVLKQYERIHHRKGEPRIVLFAHAETALHEYFGDTEYWMARRSMRFNSILQAIGNAYRRDFLGSTDQKDAVQRPERWTDEQPYREAKGGDYICVHLRRADFQYGREHQLPSLRSVANQIKRMLAQLDLRIVYLSSDCSGQEFLDLKNMLRGVHLHRYRPPREYHQYLGDGGIAIIDQIICSHARKFSGTFESTFTYRIYEEREILGFPQDMTFNTLCKHDDLEECNKNSIWPIRY